MLLFSKVSLMLMKRYLFSTCTCKLESGRTAGFIGVGSMGSKLVEKLLSNGIKVTVFDISETYMSNVKSKGAEVQTSASKVASTCDIIFTLLPHFDAIFEVLTNKNGILSTIKKGSLLVDLSTIGPVNAVRIHDMLEEKEANFLDAPVSGGVYSGLVHSGIFLAGGKKEHFIKAEPFLKVMGCQELKKNVFHIGEDIGDGQAARICNMLLFSVIMLGTAEAMNFGIRFGLDPKKLVEALNSSIARSYICEHYNPVPNLVEKAPSSADYKTGHPINLIIECLQIAQDSATRMRSPIPLSAVACQMYMLAAIRGYAELDASSVYKMISQSFS